MLLEVLPKAFFMLLYLFIVYIIQLMLYVTLHSDQTEICN